MTRCSRAIAVVLFAGLMVGCSSSDSGAKIGPAGGTISAAGATAVVPPGALPSDTALSVEAVTTGFPAIPPAVQSLGVVFAFTPHGQTFTAPVALTIPFTGATTTGLSLMSAAPGGQWTTVEGAVVSGSSMMASVTHFSFFVVAQPNATDAGPHDGAQASLLDGSWKWVSATCNGSPIDLAKTDVTYMFTGTTGTIVSAPPPGPCTQTIPFTVSYPSAGSLTLTIAAAPVCNPSNCIPSPGACGPDAVNQVFTGTYIVEGNKVTLTFPKTPTDNWACPAGLEVLVLQKL